MKVYLKKFKKNMYLPCVREADGKHCYFSAGVSNKDCTKYPCKTPHIVYIEVNKDGTGKE